jgi:hypothetical protein
MCFLYCFLFFLFSWERCDAILYCFFFSFFLFFFFFFLEFLLYFFSSFFPFFSFFYLFFPRVILPPGDRTPVKS